MVATKLFASCLLIALLLLFQLEVAVLFENEENTNDEKSEEEGFSYPENIDDDLTASRDPTFGQLTGDVQNWAAIIQNYILQVLMLK
jgi:hypothetical protein